MAGNKPGPMRQPMAKLQAAGSRRVRERAHETPWQPDLALPPCPTGLPADVEAEFDRLCEILGPDGERRLTAIDGDIVEQYARETVRWRDLEAQYDKTARDFRKASTADLLEAQGARSSLHRDTRASAKAMREIGAQLGLSPGARDGMEAPAQPEPPRPRPKNPRPRLAGPSGYKAS